MDIKLLLFSLDTFSPWKRSPSIIWRTITLNSIFLSVSDWAAVKWREEVQRRVFGFYRRWICCQTGEKWLMKVATEMAGINSTVDVERVNWEVNLFGRSHFSCGYSLPITTICCWIDGDRAWVSKANLCKSISRSAVFCSYFLKHNKVLNTDISWVSAIIKISFQSSRGILIETDWTICKICFNFPQIGFFF